MCGIAGFVSSHPLDPEHESILGRMAQSLRHRGPDHSGTWVDRDAGVALAHRRLSILDLSPLGNQPMISPSERYVITFNGEIYNYAELRKELKGLGASFRGTSDTEVLLAAFDHWGVAPSLPRLNGMFAVALWDRQGRRLHLIRDRLGEKPLYYGWQGSHFLFGSELKALRAGPGFHAPISRWALALYMRHAYVPGPHSIYEGISKLPPGTSLEVDPVRSRGTPAPVPYWSARDVSLRGAQSPETASDEDLLTELERILRDSVRLRMHADVPLGAFLSGGIDSSTIVALMQAQSSRPVRTFTIGFHEEAFNEAVWARKIAQHLKTDHTELYVSPQETLDVIPGLPELYDEPFADSSQIPTYLVSRLARRQVTVSLSGDGGDELFGGYNRYFLGDRIWQRMKPIPAPLRKLIGGAILSVSSGRWDLLLRGAQSIFPQRTLRRAAGEHARKLGRILTTDSPEAMYVDLVSHWPLTSNVVPMDVPASVPPLEQLREIDLSNFLQKMMVLDLLTYLVDDILVKVDRATMGVSLEARVPFLDHRLVEFALRLPVRHKIRGRVGKLILRRLLYRYVPAELVERPKMGFGVPLASWLRGPLRDWAEDLLNEGRLKAEGYFDVPLVRRRWEQHVTGRHNWPHHLWDVLMFEAWLRRQ